MNTYVIYGWSHRGLNYEMEEPMDVQDYGNDYAGLETYQGGFDSEEDAKRGIVRSYPHQHPNEVPDRLYIEDEPIDDYNQEGYYVPRERLYHGANKQTEVDEVAVSQDARQRAPEDDPGEEGETESYQRYHSPSSQGKPMRSHDR